MTQGRARALLGAVVVLALVVVGVVLVVTGGDPAPEPASTTGSGAATGSAPRATLALEDTSMTAVQDLTGIVLPAGTEDFLTARLSGNSQLDITFTIPLAAASELVNASGLPDLLDGQRVIIHSSPLWKLNPDGSIRGASDTFATVARSVEFVPEGADRLRARVVITPGGDAGRDDPPGGSSTPG